MKSKVLWLCSWYPNDEDHFTGDFIQRHAIAVSQFQSIDVLHVCKSKNTQSSYQHKEVNPNLNEHIFYNQVDTKNFFQNSMGLIKFFLIHLRFMKQHGKPNLIHVQIPMKSGVVALYYKWFYKIPYIVTEHYGIYNTNQDDHFKKRNFLYRYLTKLIVKNASQLTTVSKSLGDEMNDWVLKKEFKVIPNVVDTSLFHFTEPVQKERFQFIHISNMIPLKNVLGIIEATEILWKERNDFEMVMIGAANNEYEHIAASKQLLNSVISFEREIPYEHIASKMKESDALIIFSDTESQSCVVLEALCCGRPCIVTNVGGVKELINDANGYKVNVRDTNDLVSKMKMMIDAYHIFNLKTISAAAISTYAYQEVGKQFSELYTQYLKRN